METHRKTIVVIGILLLCVLCSGYLHSCFTPPTNTPCIPISYPEGKKIEAEQAKIYTFETNDAYESVIEFYRTNLKFDPPVEDRHGLIQWEEYSIRDIGVLFQCGSALNGYELELACIFVHKKDGQTAIDIMWSYNEGPATQCYELPEIEPEDYLPVLENSE